MKKMFFKSALLIIIIFAGCTKQAKISFPGHGYSDTILSTIREIPDTGKEALLIKIGNRPWDIAPAHFVSDTEYVADSEKVIVVTAKILEKL